MDKTRQNRVDTSWIQLGIAIVLALVLPGAQMIGVSVNLYLGIALLLLAFAIAAWVIINWEKTAHWGWRRKTATIVFIAIPYFFLIGEQVVNEWRIEHPCGPKTADRHGARSAAISSIV